MITFTVSDEDAEFYVASLALGILEAMRAGDVPTEHGIWTLGRPVFWQVLEAKKLVSPSVLEVVQTFDELNAAEGLELDVDELIEELTTALGDSLKNMTRETSLVIKTEHGT